MSTQNIYDQPGCWPIEYPDDPFGGLPSEWVLPIPGQLQPINRFWVSVELDSQVMAFPQHAVLSHIRRIPNYVDDAQWFGTMGF